MRIMPLVMKIEPSHIMIWVKGAQMEMLIARITANSGIEREAVSSLRANISSSSYSKRSVPCFWPKRSRASFTDETSFELLTCPAEKFLCDVFVTYLSL